MANESDKLQQRGRKRNRTETVELKLSIHKKMHDYLEHLARATFLGQTPSAVANFLLTRELTAMRQSGYEDPEIHDSYD